MPSRYRPGRGGQVLKSSIRSSDVLARIGGEEFAVIMHHIDETSVRNAITRWIAAGMRIAVLFGVR